MEYITASDCTKLAVYDYNPQGNRTIVLIHGWPLSHKIFEYQILPLVSEGFRVIEPDLRGFGTSDAPAFGYSYDRMAQDIYEIVKVKKLCRFVLVGFSMGGAISLRYMRLFHGEGVSRLFLLSAAAPCFSRRPGCPGGISREEADQLIEQAKTDRAKLGCTFAYNQLFASPHSDAIKGWFKEIAWSASGIGTVRTAISLREEDGRKDLGAVKVPTVIIHGEKDVVVSNELVMQQHREIRGSRFYTLRNSGHGIMYDELDKFNRIFLGELKDDRRRI